MRGTKDNPSLAYWNLYLGEILQVLDGKMRPYNRTLMQNPCIAHAFEALADKETYNGASDTSSEEMGHHALGKLKPRAGGGGASGRLGRRFDAPGSKEIPLEQRELERDVRHILRPAVLHRSYQRRREFVAATSGIKNAQLISRREGSRSLGDTIVRLQHRRDGLVDREVIGKPAGGVLRFPNYSDAEHQRIAKLLRSSGTKRIQKRRRDERVEEAAGIGPTEAETAAVAEAETIDVDEEGEEGDAVEGVAVPAAAVQAAAAAALREAKEAAAMENVAETVQATNEDQLANQQMADEVDEQGRGMRLNAMETETGGVIIIDDDDEGDEDADLEQPLTGGDDDEQTVGAAAISHKASHIQVKSILLCSPLNPTRRLDASDDCQVKLSFYSANKVQIKIEALYTQPQADVETVVDAAEAEVETVVDEAGGGDATVPRTKKPQPVYDKENSVRLTLDNHAIVCFDQRSKDGETTGIALDLVAPVSTVEMLDPKTDKSFITVDHPSIPLFQTARAATRIVIWFKDMTPQQLTSGHEFVAAMLRRDEEHLGDLAQADGAEQPVGGPLGFLSPIPPKHDPTKHEELCAKMRKATKKVINVDEAWVKFLDLVLRFEGRTWDEESGWHDPAADWKPSHRYSRAAPKPCRECARLVRLADHEDGELSGRIVLVDASVKGFVTNPKSSERLPVDDVLLNGDARVHERCMPREHFAIMSAFERVTKPGDGGAMDAEGGGEQTVGALAIMAPQDAALTAAPAPKADVLWSKCCNGTCGKWFRLAPRDKGFMKAHVHKTKKKEHTGSDCNGAGQKPLAQVSATTQAVAERLWKQQQGTVEAAPAAVDAAVEPATLVGAVAEPATAAVGAEAAAAAAPVAPAAHVAAPRTTRPGNAAQQYANPFINEPPVVGAAAYTAPERVPAPEPNNPTNDPYSLIGKGVRKAFPEGTYDGLVQSFDKRLGYLLQYSDGDTEHVNKTTARKLVRASEEAKS